MHATLILSLTTQAISAQIPMPGVHLNEDRGERPRTKEQQEYDKALDRAYQSAIKKISEQNKPDPGATSDALLQQRPKTNSNKPVPLC
jgi:hypothetical protein